MPDGPKYLSTDPNAGLPATSPTYLSTDPHAGVEVAPDKEQGLQSALGIMGRSVGVPGVGGGGFMGGTAAEYFGNPRNWPNLVAAAAAPVTGGGSIPAAMGVAALASGAGSVAKNAAEYFLGHGKPSVGAAAADIAKDAGAQAALTGATGLAGKALQYAGNKAYGWLGLSPKQALAEDFGRDEMAAAGVKLGVIPGTQRAVDQAAAARGAAAAETENILKTANDTAPPIRAKEVMGAFKPGFQEIRAQATTGRDMSGEAAALADRAKRVAASFGGTPGTAATPDRVVTMSRTMPTLAESGDEAVMRAGSQLGPLAETVPSRVLMPTEQEVRAARQLGPAATAIPRGVLNGPPVSPEPLQFVSPGRPATPAVPGGIDMLEGQVRKTAAMRAAKEAFAAQNKGGLVSQPNLLVDQALGDAYKTALEARAPGLEAANAKTQALIGLTKALSDAQNRPVVMRAIASLATHGTAPLATLSPVAGATGIALDRAGGALRGALTPAMIRAALLDQMGGDQGSQP